jgi:hypothetical protein
MDNELLKINHRRYVLAVETDIKDNDRLKKNHQRYVLAGMSDVKDNDRLKVIAVALRKLSKKMCRIIFGSN